MHLFEANIHISAAEELLKWYDLLEKGIITPEEFEKKKRELI
ncbi:SHOCT domain-containing protein [Methanobrevibacter sp. TLL-48-HuF1]|nr:MULTISPECIES: SHOCT domain-containing protein [Methanobrevibacter]URN49503.1 SHOCT domain-containing protein [Methanobrevibacter sp. TLL-48-HuF1]